MMSTRSSIHGNNGGFGLALSALAFMLAAAPGVFALSTDQDQRIEIEADAGELDDARNINIYTGDVIVIQGSIRITGDRMTVHYTDDNEVDTLVMEGRPATYRQLPDDSDVHDEAQAMRMEYQKLNNLVILLNDARVKQTSASFSGDRIEYDSANSRVKVTSEPAGRPGEQQDNKERVKIIIPP